MTLNKSKHEGEGLNLKIYRYSIATDIARRDIDIGTDVGLKIAVIAEYAILFFISQSSLNLVHIQLFKSSKVQALYKGSVMFGPKVISLRSYLIGSFNLFNVRVINHFI